MIRELLAAFVGTAAFSVLYGVPRRCYVWCGAAGSAGWLVYRCCVEWRGAAAAACLAALAVTLLARFLAVRGQCPVLIFMLPGIFPLVPGAGIYWTSYYLVMNEMDQALTTGYEAVKCAAAIVLGIVLAFELPQKLFRRAGKTSGIK